MRRIYFFIRLAIVVVVVAVHGWHKCICTTFGYGHSRQTIENTNKNTWRKWNETESDCFV